MILSNGQAPCRRPPFYWLRGLGSPRHCRPSRQLSIGQLASWQLLVRQARSRQSAIVKSAMGKQTVANSATVNFTCGKPTSGKQAVANLVFGNEKRVSSALCNCDCTTTIIHRPDNCFYAPTAISMYRHIVSMLRQQLTCPDSCFYATTAVPMYRQLFLCRNHNSQASQLFLRLDSNSMYRQSSFYAQT